jgi:hypothetical protein
VLYEKLKIMNKIFLKLICISILTSGLYVNKLFSQVTSQEIDAIVQNAIDNFTVAKHVALILFLFGSWI